MVQPFINKTPNYSVGTASVANGAVAVTFVGANLVQTDPTTGVVSSVCSVGDRFNVPGVAEGTIQAIDPGGAALTLSAPWTGATQSNVAYTIYRYSTPAQGVVLAAANSAITQGQDSNPVLSETIDDGTARLKLRLKSSAASIAVGATGAADASLVEGVDISQAGVVSFPNGALPPADWSNNRVINGGFDVWQGGVNFSAAYNVPLYVADQWLVLNNSSAPATVSKVAAPAGFSSAYAMNVSVAASGAGAVIGVYQRFEAQALADLDSGAAVLSFDLNASTSAGALSSYVAFICCTAIDNGTFSNWLPSVGYSIPVGAGRVKVPLTGAQLAGVKNGAQVAIIFNGSAGGGNVSATIGAVKLEKGSVASPWSPKPIAREWQDCQRFYEASIAVWTIQAGAVLFLPFKTTKRATPTLAVTVTSGAPLTISGGGYTGQDAFRVQASAQADFSWTANARL